MATPLKPETGAPTIAVGTDPAGDVSLRHQGQRIASELNLPYAESPPSADVEFLLMVTAERLELRVIGGDTSLRGGRPIYVGARKRDVASPAGARLGQPLLRAVGIRRRGELQSQPPRIIDTTAGWGGDALMLASLGCRILAVERHPLVAKLLTDGTLRAIADEVPGGNRVTVVHADATDVLGRLDTANPLPPPLDLFAHPDVVYIDPMFPPRRGHAIEGKAMRVLRRLAGPDGGGHELLEVALRLAPPRVVVKRPLRAVALGTTAPSVSYRGKSMRYDVYLKPGQQGPSTQNAR